MGAEPRTKGETDGADRRQIARHLAAIRVQVTRAVEDARAAGRSIVPLCPYALSQFKRHPDWHDVWNGGPKS